MMSDRPPLGRIVSSYFVAGFETSSDHVVRTAPIIRYMIGWHVNRVWSYCLSKNWQLERVA